MTSPAQSAAQRQGTDDLQTRPPREQRAGPAGVPATDELGPLDRATLEAVFDHSATPDAFARSGRGGQAIDANLGGLVRLVGYDVDTQRARPGGRLAVTLYWQTLQPLADDYHAFVHLEVDQIWGQADGRPVCWTYPTTDSAAGTGDCRPSRAGNPPRHTAGRVSAAGGHVLTG